MSHTPRSKVVWLAAAFLLLATLPAFGQEPAAGSAAPDLSSPRATVTTFLAAMNDVNANQPDRMAAALACMNLTGIPTAERDATGPARARQLFDILDDQTIVLEDIPAETANRQIEIPVALGEDNKLELSLSNQNEWRFTTNTVSELPDLHALLLVKREETAAETDEETQVDPRLASPRATMRTFIEGMNRWDEGGEEDVLATLDLSEVPEAVRRETGAAAAELIKEVLDRFPAVVYQTIDDATQIGDKETYTHVLEDDVELTLHKIRADEASERVWQFTPSTIANAETLYDRVYDRDLVVTQEGQRPRSTSLRVRNWVADNYPALLGKVFTIEYWRWIGLVAVIVFGVAVSRLFAFLLTFFVGRVFRRENLQVDDEARGNVKSFARPVRLMFMAWMWWIGLGLLSMGPQIYTVLLYAAVTVTYGGAIWAGWTLIELIGTYLWARAERTHSRFDDLVVPLVIRSLKALVVVVGALAIAHEVAENSFNQVLAGLGLGGLAFALAARDTIANLFGSVMILADRPFEIGDWIQVGDLDGSVESVGIRSTRVRTFYNSLVTIPNSELTNAVIDNYGQRKYRRIKTTLGVTYDTPPEKLDAFCEGIRQLIREHPYTRKDYFHVYFHDYGPYSLDVLVYCFVQTPDWGTELRERHRLMTDILRLAHRLDVEFAFPTQMNVSPRKSNGDASRAPVPDSTYDALRMGRKQAVTIVEETVGRGMKPPPVDFEAAYPDVDDLIDARKGGDDDDDGETDDGGE